MKGAGITGFCERRVPEQEDPERRFIRMFLSIKDAVWNLMEAFGGYN